MLLLSSENLVIQNRSFMGRPSIYIKRLIICDSSTYRWIIYQLHFGELSLNSGRYNLYVSFPFLIDKHPHGKWRQAIIEEISYRENVFCKCFHLDMYYNKFKPILLLSNWDPLSSYRPFTFFKLPRLILRGSFFYWLIGPQEWNKTKRIKMEWNVLGTNWTRC